jgi:hypothetical protein
LIDLTSKDQEIFRAKQRTATAQLYISSHVKFVRWIGCRDAYVVSVVEDLGIAQSGGADEFCDIVLRPAASSCGGTGRAWGRVLVRFIALLLRSQPDSTLFPGVLILIWPDTE